MTQKFLIDGKWMTLAQVEKTRATTLANPIENVAEESTENAKVDEPAPEVPVEGLTDLGAIMVLKKQCDAKGIEYHHASGVKKLTELLADTEKSV